MTIDEIRSIPLFRDVPPAELDALADQMTREERERGEALFEAGDPPDAMYIVDRGVVEVVDPSSRRPLASLGPGSIVGEIGLLLDEPRATSVRALTDVEVRRLAKPVVERLVAEHPHVAVALAREVGRRLNTLDRRDLSEAPRLVTVPAPGAGQLADAVAALGDGVAVVPLGACGPVHGDVDWRGALDPAEILDLVSAPQPGLRVVVVALPEDPTPAAVTAARAADYTVALGADLPGWALEDVPPLRRVPVRPGHAGLARIARWVSGRAVGLALSSGGSKACAHGGVIRVLREVGITIDAVAGSSGGAIAAATFAHGESDELIRLRLRDLPDAFRLRHLGANIPPRHGLFRGRGPYEMIQRWYGDADVSSTVIPLYVVACDLATGEEVVLDRGPLADAIRASISIPGVLDPWRIDGRVLVDGGLVAPLPARVLRDAGLGFVIASNVAGQEPQSANGLPSVIETIGRMVTTMERQLLSAQVPAADVHIRPVVRAANSFDFSRYDELADIGEAAAREQMVGLENVLEQSGTPRAAPPSQIDTGSAGLPGLRRATTRARTRTMSTSFVWVTSVRDLRWRWRRFLIAAVAAALVLGLTVLLSGIVEHLDGEIQRTVNAMGADEFVVAKGIPGPFTSVAPIPISIGDALAGQPAIERADPVVMLPQTIERAEPLDSYVIGFSPGGLGTPPVAEGRAPQTATEAAVDAKAAIDVGSTVEVGGRTFTVVGVTHGLTVLGERPNIYITIDAAQAAFFGGTPVATAFLVKGTAADLPAEVAVVDRDSAVADLRRPMADTIDSIALFRSLLWVVAAAIVGSVLYLSALERSRDLAVLKATGAAGRDLVAGLVLQAVALAVAASVVAIVLAELLKPVFPAGISLPIPLLLTAPLIAIVVGVIGSLAGLRRVVRIDPALAFGGP